MHTNLDNVLSEFSSEIAKRLGVENTKILKPKKIY